MADKEETFEPTMIGFFCNWCTATAADLAGTTRLQYPANIHPIRVMCSGTVDPVYVLRAWLSGADGVIIGTSFVKAACTPPNEFRQYVRSLALATQERD